MGLLGESDLLAGLGAECAALFPLPGDAERVWLADALLELIAEIPWLLPHAGGDAVRVALEDLREVAASRVPAAQRGGVVTVLSGEYGAAGAIIGLGRRAGRGLLVLRGLYWVALRGWRARGDVPRQHRDAIASALRAAVRSPGSRAAQALDRILTELARAADMQSAIGALESFDAVSHGGLRDAWQGGFWQFLSDETGALPPAIGPRGPAPPPTSGPRGPGVRPGNQDEIDAGRPVVIPLRRRIPLPDQLPGEPPEEFSSPVDLVLVPGYGTGTIRRRRAEYRARQTVWSRNTLLLTLHPDALPPDVYGAALRALNESLEQEGLPADAAIGRWVCLLKAMSGRTSAGIRAMCANSGSTELSGLRINLEQGSIDFPPYWHERGSEQTEGMGGESAPGYFRPDPAQREWLIPATELISLPLPRSFARLLRAHRSTLQQIAELDLPALDRLAAEAARTLSGDMGIDLTVATLRRSLGPQLMEATGDLAMSQLICGDSFGRPSAQQHYYAPRRKDVAAAYCQAVCSHFQQHSTTPIQAPGDRVGSALLVKPQSARLLAASSGDFSHKSHESGEEAPELREHRRLLDHLARMVITTIGHRPTEALFELTRHDIDLRTGAALLCDKRIDVAHDPRLVCLASVTCEQIAIYLDHLTQWAAKSPPMRDAIGQVLAGRAPLLSDFDARGQIVRPTIAGLKARSPVEWGALPWNWGRTYIRTRGIETGAHPALVNMQLGHLDADGYPFSQQSPTIPSEVLGQIQPWLDRLLRNQGWRVHRPIAEGPPSAAAPPDVGLPPLQDWSPRIDQSEQAARIAHAQWERDLHNGARRRREQALQVVLSHPAVIAMGIASAYESQSAPAPSVNETDVFRLRDELIEGAGDDASAAIAVARALRRVLAVVAKRTGQALPAIPLPFAVRRPLDNPFFQGACLALTQIHTLRDHVATRSAEKRPDRSFELQVARTTEALAVFGGVDDPDRLVAILAARKMSRPSARMPDLLLVPLADGYVVAVRGTAALALGNLAHTFPDDPLPSLREIESNLARILPAWATKGRQQAGLLARLCSTTAVVNRFEKSPAARFGLDPAHGSTHATVEEQLAYIDGDPVGPDRARTGGKEEALPTCGPAESGSSARAMQPARKQYLALCRAIPRAHRKLSLPLTGAVIPATNLHDATARKAVIAELDEQLKSRALQPVVRMLCDWIRALAVDGAHRGKALAYRTLSTYLNRIGGALVEVLGEVEYARWDEDLLEAAYWYALDGSEKARGKVAAGLLSFHAHCSAKWDVPDLDLGFVYAQLRGGRQRADAALILPVERATALEILRQQAWEGHGDDFANTRIARLADWTAYYLAWSGARVNEVLGLQVRDLGVRPDGTMWARVRPNRLRRLKTPAASRTLVFRNGSGESEHRVRVKQRLEDVRRHTGPRKPESAFVATDFAADEGEAHPAGAVGQMIRDVLARATGQPSQRLHRLRHLAAMEALIPVALAPEDAMWMESASGEAKDPGFLLPRHLAGIAVPMGHYHWRTTIQWYLHLPWLLDSRSAQHSRARYLTRRYAAGALGYTCATVDSLLRNRKVAPVWAWFGHFRPSRHVPAIPAPPVGPAAPQASVGWTALLVGKLVDLAARSQDVEPAMRSVGAPMRDLDLVVEIAERWEAKLGLRLIPARVGGVNRRCPGRAVRAVHADRLLERLWREYDSGAEAESYRRVISAFFCWLSPSRGHEVVLPRAEANELVAYLTRAGVHSQIRTADLSGGRVELAIQRGGGDSAQGQRYHGMGMRRVLAVIGMTIELQRGDNC